ncbi:DUF3379 domain-containing protein [Tahibacter amnicola]|uniref:DUF3379 domain-containing protein n=1 Tax=Tahibacter amnicola TaxID=2976241 RepID=A0ABY6BEM0_9GAMM|nr:DUF3379 domain-containing protein [Tahibacter amnicola]UXI68481.1 DUF3379 domain-containing protein [Tahibacter amnicola]
MNCLEYRRLLGAEPRRESLEMVAHRRECSGCAGHHARTLGFELQLRRTLNVPIPAGLSERILLAQATQARHNQPWKRRLVGWGVAAAGLLATVTVGWLALPPRTALADALVEHIAHEPLAFAERPPLPDGAVMERFRSRGVSVPGPLPATVSYVAACPVGDYKTVHMVQREGDAKVTVFYVTNHREGRGEFQRAGMHGRKLPLGDGTLVMMAADNRAFDQIEKSWRTTMEGGPALATGAP